MKSKIREVKGHKTSLARRKIKLEDSRIIHFCHKMTNKRIVISQNYMQTQNISEDTHLSYCHGGHIIPEIFLD